MGQEYRGRTVDAGAECQALPERECLLFDVEAPVAARELLLEAMGLDELEPLLEEGALVGQRGEMSLGREHSQRVFGRRFESLERELVDPHPIRRVATPP